MCQYITQTHLVTKKITQKNHFHKGCHKKTLETAISAFDACEALGDNALHKSTQSLTRLVNVNAKMNLKYNTNKQ